MNAAGLLARAHGRYQRETARRLFRRPMTIQTDQPLISFTFDDFPRSAFLTGGAILQTYGVRGTYYTSFGLMGTTAPTGPIFLREDIASLLEQGHELGCHTFEHRDAWSTPRAAFEAAIQRNRLELQDIAPTASFHSFSYPISPPSASTKRLTARHFPCCRGGGQTLNAGTIDLSYLAAYFMEQSRSEPEKMKSIIDSNSDACGWLIFATHDVASDPTPFGCTPALFEEIVRYASASGARILPVAEALRVLQQ